MYKFNICTFNHALYQTLLLLRLWNSTTRTFSRGRISVCIIAMMCFLHDMSHAYSVGNRGKTLSSGQSIAFSFLSVIPIYADRLWNIVCLGPNLHINNRNRHISDNILICIKI